MIRQTLVRVSGKVQGVGFRAATKGKADELGLVGYVRNLPDGRVEALFYGEEQQVEAMLIWCQQGSPLSQVGDLEIIEETPYVKIFSSFKII